MCRRRAVFSSEFLFFFPYVSGETEFETVETGKNANNVRRSACAAVHSSAFIFLFLIKFFVLIPFFFFSGSAARADRHCHPSRLLPPAAAPNLTATCTPRLRRVAMTLDRRRKDRVRAAVSPGGDRYAAARPGSRFPLPPPRRHGRRRWSRVIYDDRVVNIICAGFVVATFVFHFSLSWRERFVSSG